MSGNVFISYRRDDAAAWAGRLHMALERSFAREQLFMDVDSIQAGLDFAKVIDAEVAKCDVMLVVIGKGWLDVADAAGRRRLDDASDFVRLEVESALRRDIRVVPVLVDGASLPKAEDLPEGMQGLVRRQAWPLSHARFGPECEGLIEEISRYVTPGGGAASATARVDWIVEFSWFLLLIVGLGGVAALLLWSVATYMHYKAGPQSADQSTLLVMLVLVLGSAASLFLASRWLYAGKLAALWFFSAALAALFAGLSASVLKYNNVLLFCAIVFGLTYAVLSGPALILWRRRRRG